MKTKVRIFKPARNPMQSGRAGRQDKWCLQGADLSARVPDHLMGWTSADDTNDQITMMFDNKTAAIEFAESKGWSYEVHDPAERVVKPQNYLDNFKYHPVVYHPVKVEKKTEEKKAAKPERSKRSGTRVKKKATKK